MLTPTRAGFLGSSFPPRSRPGWPASGSGILPFPGQRLAGCGIYSTRSGTDVDDIITTPLFVPLGMLNATSPTGVTCAFVSLSVVKESTGDPSGGLEYPDRIRVHAARPEHRRRGPQVAHKPPGRTTEEHPT
ncbi:hypothetical protein HAX54_001767 [Datura stramonium]|uniref:Uncharacterized protein n=1 Tax=Datura stramonium TaxID=4076 RepID=A0ABS8T3V7_DATST|nr:hypothetical protein [Datura stramonium]